MKLPAGFEKWGSALLGLASVWLLANLAGEYRTSHHGRSTVHAASDRAPRAEGAKSTPRPMGDLAQYDPTVHFDALKALDSRPLPDEDRNPFDFVLPPAPPAPPPVAAAPAAPPPPPPPPLKAMGYNELPGGNKEAIITYNEDVQVVHEGDLIASRFKIVKINPTQIVVEDGNTHQTLELPFPQ